MGPAIQSGVIVVPLAAASEDWPEGIRQEITQLSLGGAQMQVPADELGRGLRLGKLSFAWKQLLLWTNSRPASASALGDTTLELPLKVIAPLYLAQHQPSSGRKKVTVADNIPDLFVHGKPPATQVATPVTGAPASAPTEPAPATLIPPPPPPPAPASPSPGVVRSPTNLGELFGPPGKTSWSPTEVVQRTSALANVSGALIAYEDGLLVAAHLPAPFKGDVMAAFLPQLFGRMNQSAKGMGLGEVHQLSFTANGVPWYICRCGTLVFVAMGRVRGTLPLPALELVAHELTRLGPSK
ncbi:MAG: roadblock/LC7 domain-containing protein [Verrucomicrobia bacterium]|nr:roadblock/LC7 domain-containing protein [Verrucomicrobiota bacterium]